MKKELQNLIKNPFVRNVAIVATGTAAAQVVTIVFSPIITRLYGPEAFGVLGVYMAIVGIITPIAALSYPIAIVLPKSDADARGLIRISLFVAVVMSVFTMITLAFFNDQIVSLLQIEVIEPYLYLIPLVILSSALLQVTQQWLIRKKQFIITARVAFLQALFLNSTKVGIGWFNPIASVLIVLSMLGTAIHAMMLIIGARCSQPKQTKETSESTTAKELARKYKDFPLFRSPQVFINSISQSLPVLLLASFYGPVSAGFYTIGKTVLGMPVNLIGKSVGDVFYPRIVEAASNGEDITRLIIKATLGLAVIGIIPFGIIVIFGPRIFGFVFGADWVVAGEYSRWLALWYFFRFINQPSVVAVPVLRLQRGLLIYEVFSTLSKVVALIVGFYILKKEIQVVALFSLTGIVAYVYLILWVIESSKKIIGSLKT